MENTNSLAFGLAYVVLVAYASIIMIFYVISNTWKNYNESRGNYWIYGTCNGSVARKHKKEGNVQFIIWNEGDHAYVDGISHTSKKWVDFDSSWWKQFKERKLNEN